MTRASIKARTASKSQKGGNVCAAACNCQSHPIPLFTAAPAVEAKRRQTREHAERSPVGSVGGDHANCDLENTFKT